jgi:hypothetical protein
MAAKAAGEAVGAIEALSAVRRPPTGKTRHGRPLAYCGPTRARVTDAERLQRLRKRLCATEVLQTIKAISEAASELALTAPESILPDIADFVDRAAEKAERLSPPTATPKAVTSEKPHRVGFNGQGFSTISMRISEWTVDSSTATAAAWLGTKQTGRCRHEKAA